MLQLMLLALTAAAAPTAGPATSPSSRPAEPQGRWFTLEAGRLFAPSTLAADDSPLDVWVHFHGHAATVAREFVASGAPGVLVVVHHNGLSSVYTRPFRDEKRFGRLLAEARERLDREGIVPAARPEGRLRVSSFSAGFGAVRETLKNRAYFDRIDAICTLDSIYAGYTGPPDQHRVDPDDMTGWRRFAEAAAADRKVFVISHSYLVPGSYASTIETADDLIRHVGAHRRAVNEKGPGPMTIISRADRGNFHVYGCQGSDGEAHMAHLRNMGWWIRRTVTVPTSKPAP